MEDAIWKVRKTFGNKKLSSHQEDAIKYVVEKTPDVFVKLPTRFEKSLLY